MGNERGQGQNQRRWYEEVGKKTCPHTGEAQDQTSLAPAGGKTDSAGERKEGGKGQLCQYDFVSKGMCQELGWGDKGLKKQ